MNYLLDTNIWLERMLDQERAAEVAELVAAVEQYGLDFDDAYQYVAAKRYDLTFISLDSDFDRTDLGRRSPDEIIRQIATD